MRLLLTLCLFNLWMLSLTVQASGPSVRFKQLSIEHGLSQSTVYAVQQDNQGFIWFATQDGLNRFDGYEFKVFRHERQNPSSLSNNYINTLYYDSNNILWIGTRGGGLDKFDPHSQSFIHYQHQSADLTSLSHNDVKSIYEDNKGTLWVGTDNGLNKYHRQNQHFERFEHNAANANSLSSNKISSITQDNSGKLWIGTQDAGLNQFDGQQFIHFKHQANNLNSLSHNAVSAIIYASDEHLWIATQGGLNRFNLQTQQFEHFRHDPNNPDGISGDSLLSVYQDKKDRLWIGSYGSGLNRFDANCQCFEHFTFDSTDIHSLSHNFISSLFEDDNGILWIGTVGGGVSQYNTITAHFNHFKQQLSDNHSLAGKSVSSIYQDDQGTLWVGHWEGGLNQYDSQTKRFTHFKHQPSNPLSLSHDGVTAFLSDKKGGLWVGTNGGGLNLFNRQTGHFRHFRHDPSNPYSLSHDRVRAIIAAPRDHLWIGTNGGGLNHFAIKTGQFERFLHQPSDPHSLSHNTVQALYQDSRGELWVATSDGLNQFNQQTEQFTRFKHAKADPQSISDSAIKSIFETKDNTLWFGTFDGLSQFNRQTGTFTNYREKQGLPNNFIYGIHEDNSGFLWLSTNHGLSRFNRQNKTFKNYDVNDGLQSNEFNTNAHFQSNSGELFFGGINGFNRFYPEDIIDNKQIPSVVLTNFLLFNKPIGIKDKATSMADKSPSNQPFALSADIDALTQLTLTHQQNLMSFEFAALHFSNPMQNQYAYQLEGWDKDWINTDAKNRRATYTNIPPGNYTLRIKASNKDGYWNASGKSLNITILPPPWKTWWAYTLYFILIILLMSLAIYTLSERRKGFNQKIVNRQLQQVDKLKDAFLANTSHELRTPLNGIIGLTESLIDGVAGQLPIKAKQQLAMVVSSGKRLANLVNDILDFSKLENHTLVLHRQPVDLHNLTALVLALSEHLTGDKKLKLINHVSSDLPAVEADEERLQQILYNLVGNGIKFTEHGEICVTATEQTEWLHISVSDSGIGIAEEAFDSIFKSFEQVQESTTRRYGGTGLGLAVSRQLVELHGSQLKVTSTLGQGSTFSFSLPVSQSTELANSSTNQALARLQLLQPGVEAQDEEEPDEPLPAHLVNTDGSQFRLLVVDDEPINRLVLCNYLLRQNYQLLEATGGQEALDAIEQHGPFDLVLLDIMMPEISGYDVCERIRQRYSVNDLPVIFLTAKNQQLDIQQSFAVGANDYLSKPVAKHELLSRVATHLKLLDAHRNLEHKVDERTAELAESNQRLKALIEICSQITATLDLTELLNKAYQCIKDLMHIDIFYIGQYHPDKKHVEFMLAIEGDRHFSAPLLTMTEDNRPAVWCIKHKRSLVINDFDQDFDHYFADQPVAPPIAARPAGSLMCWPLIAGDHVIGILSVQSYQKNAYDEPRQNIIQTLASTLAIALDNANAYSQIEEKHREVGVKRDEVKQKNHELVAAQQQLVQSEKMASLGTLTAGVAHEINNPTNFVHVSAQNLEVDLKRFQQFLFDLAGDDADEEVLDSFRQQFEPLYDHLQTIKEGSSRIATIVQDLRAFSQLDAADKKTACITDLLRSTLHLVQTKYLEITEFVTEFTDNPELQCYPAQLNQVFMNLIVNACDAIRDRQREQKSPKLKQLGKIIIACNVVDNAVEVTIKDNGYGMTKETLSKLFEPFYTTKDIGEGTGLGLSISFGIVQKHQGELFVESELGVGSVFTLRLPMG